MLDGKQSLISRSRRNFIKGRVGPTSRHIASLLVQAWPDGIDTTETALVDIPGVESHGSAGTGKLILTVDVDDDAQLVETISRVEATTGVITASLVFHQMEEGEEL